MCGWESQGKLMFGRACALGGTWHNLDLKPIKVQCPLLIHAQRPLLLGMLKVVGGDLQVRAAAGAQLVQATVPAARVVISICPEQLQLPASLQLC